MGYNLIVPSYAIELEDSAVSTNGEGLLEDGSMPIGVSARLTGRGHAEGTPASEFKVEGKDIIDGVKSRFSIES